MKTHDRCHAPALMLIPLLGIGACTPAPQMTTPAAVVQAKTQGKISSELAQLLTRWLASDQGRHPFEPPAGIHLIEGHVAIEAAATADGALLLQSLQRLGLRDGQAYGLMVSGQLPIAALSELDRVSTLHHAWASQFTRQHTPGPSKPRGPQEGS